MTTKKLDKPQRQKTEIYSRCVGYLSPLSRWNNGKLSEYKDRQNYKII